MPSIHGIRLASIPQFRLAFCEDDPPDPVNLGAADRLSVFFQVLDAIDVAEHLPSDFRNNIQIFTH